MQGRCIIVPTPDKKSYPTIAKTNCHQPKILTRGNKTKRKGKVEDVDIHFCGNNSFDEPDFGNKDKEANNEGKDYSKHYTAISHHTEKERRGLIHNADTQTNFQFVDSNLDPQKKYHMVST